MTDGQGRERPSEATASGCEGTRSRHTLTRRGFLGAGALAGLAAMAWPAERAWAWSSWTNATSEQLKKYGMGDCIHEDLVQIAYARAVRAHQGDSTHTALIDPWAGQFSGADRTFATVAGDTVERGTKDGESLSFADEDDLATRLFRENLAYLRIGSYWNDAAADTLADFGYSCFYANSVPTFSGEDYYSGAWDVGQHLVETNEKNKTYLVGGLDALVQFTMNDRNNFIHGMISSTASHKGFIKQSEAKTFALQWLGVAYEYARTGEVRAIEGVTQEQAQKIFNGFIDTYGQLDTEAHDMRVSLKASDNEASLKIPHRRLRLRALGMVCHTLEDFWCPAHTLRSYHDGGTVPKNAILAFCNYKMQNGNKLPMNGYHAPFDRYALSDIKGDVDWREALTRGKDTYPGTEKLANVVKEDAGWGEALGSAHTKFNTLGMNETIDCITKLFDHVFRGTAWDGEGGVRAWLESEVMVTHFDADGQSLVCEAGRRSLHTPTFIIAPLKSQKRSYRKVGLSAKHAEMVAAAEAYDAWQRGTHLYFTGEDNKDKSKYVPAGYESKSIWSDEEGEARLVALVDRIYEGYEMLDEAKRVDLLQWIGMNGCHDTVAAFAKVRGMLQEFNIDLRGELRANDDATLARLSTLTAFFESGLKASAMDTSSDVAALGLAPADDEESYQTASMAIQSLDEVGDGSYVIGVRDMDSLESSVMRVPAGTPGVDRLKEGATNLTISYALASEFEDDLDYAYDVKSIASAELSEDLSIVNGTVLAVADDKKSLSVGVCGKTYKFKVRSGASVPEAGAYACFWFVESDSSLELVGFEELDAPGDVTQVTYEVAAVYGSSLCLYTGDEDEDAEGGHRDYIQVDLGTADIFEVPREGTEATVRYHDVGYNDLATGSDGSGFALSFPSVYTQDDDDDLNDSPGTPGYVEMGDNYGKLDYGSEFFHVADAIGTPDDPPADPVDPVDPDDPVDPGGSTDPGEGDSSDGGDSGDGGDAAGGGSKVDPVAEAERAKPTSAGGKIAQTDDPSIGIGAAIAATAVAGAAIAAGSTLRGADGGEGDAGQE